MSKACGESIIKQIGQPGAADARAACVYCCVAAELTLPAQRPAGSKKQALLQPVFSGRVPAPHRRARSEMIDESRSDSSTARADEAANAQPTQNRANASFSKTGLSRRLSRHEPTQSMDHESSRPGGAAIH